ncbi:MAG: OmpA family protein, partial [bacterium]
QKVSTGVQDIQVKEERVEDPLAHLPPPAPSSPQTVPEPSPPDVVLPPPANPLPPPQIQESEPPPLAAAVEPPAEPEIPSVFFFDIPFYFDQSSLRFDAIAMVEVNASRLKNQREWTLVLEGRADEVGTTEYNLVLGEQRAQAVREYLVGLGLPATALQTVSYGKEQPLCYDHSLECWRKNRTVRFVLEDGSAQAPTP